MRNTEAGGGKWYRCEHCWRKATHSIGIYENAHHLCTKHWQQAVDKIAYMNMTSVLGCHKGLWND